MARASLFVCLVGCLTLLGCKDNSLAILDSRDLAGADLAGVHDMAGCEGATEGASCSVPGQWCGECNDPCQFCNKLKCDNGKWTHIEIFPGSCQDMSTAPACTLGNDPLPCSANNDPCPQNGATCNGTQCVCVSPVCTQGQDQTCNDDNAISSVAGHCNSAGACDCLAGYERNPQTGKCRVAAFCPGDGVGSCSTVGEMCKIDSHTYCTCTAENGTSPKWVCTI